MSPRLSIIPAPAIVDPALEPRDLQVLCLLGRHTNDQGWCSRSQVKMARELRCARSTVQASIDRLCDAGWVSRKRRDGGGEDDQPSAAYAYRVILDRDDAALPAPAPEENPPEKGVPTDRHPADLSAPVPAHGSAPVPIHASAPVTTPLNDPPLTTEREMRARATDEFIRKFVAVWPTAAVDSQSRIAHAAAELTPDEQQAALEAIPRFLDYLKRCKRGHAPAGFTYLGEKRWTLLDAEPKRGAASAFVRVDPREPDGRAVLIACAIGLATEPFRDSEGRINYRGEITPQLLALANAPARDAWLQIRDRQQVGAWVGFINRYVTTSRRRLPVDDTGASYLMAPWPWPPRVDGTLSETAPEPAMTADDENAFASEGK